MKIIWRTTTYPPNERTTRKKVVEYLKACQPNYYHYLRKSGELEDYITDTMARINRYAISFKETGMGESEAWNMAVRNSVKVVVTPDISTSVRQLPIHPSRELVFAAIVFFASIAIQSIFVIMQTSLDNNKPILIRSASVILALSLGGFYYSFSRLSKPKKNTTQGFIWFAIGVLIGFVLTSMYPNILSFLHLSI